MCFFDKKPLTLAILMVSALPMLAYANTLTPTTTATAPTVANTANAGTPKDGVIATVNNEIILKSELNAAIQALATQIPPTATNAQTLANQALDALIVRKLQLEIIKRANLVPNDTVINEQLLVIAKQYGFDTLEQFATDMNKKSAGSYDALRQEIIETAAIQALWQHQLASRVKISEQNIQAFLASPDGQALNQEEYHTIHVRVPYLDDPNLLTAEQRHETWATALRLRQALQQGKDLATAMREARGNYAVELQGADTGFHPAAYLPRELAPIITKLAVNEVSEPMLTDVGVDVIMLAGKRSGEAVIAPEWQTSHILVRVDNLQNANVAEQKINALYAALQQGQSFETLAKAYSDDKGSATQAGNLGWVGTSQMVAEFEQVMKNTPKGNYSTPFRTQFGYHILKVHDTRSRDVSEQYRRAQAEQILLSRLAPQAQEDWINELKAAAYINIKK